MVRRFINMNINEIKQLTKGKQYNFLRDNEHLGKNIVLLGVTGSHGTGVNTKNSDVDIRGCATNSKREILLGKDFEKIEDKPTDTIVYSFPKLVRLLTKCSPGVIELLGLKKEYYLYISEVGQRILDNKKMFLTQKAIKSFGGAVTNQLKLIRSGKAKNIGKECSLLIRMYLIGLDIIEKGEIITYREKERDLLLDIRNGKYIDKNGNIMSEFFKMVQKYEDRFIHAKEITTLPKESDWEAINDFISSVNEDIVCWQIPERYKEL